MKSAQFSYAKKPSDRPYPPKKFHVGEQESSTIRSQINNALEVIRRTMQVDEDVYYLLDLKISSYHPTTDIIVSKFNGNILTRIEENKIIVSSTVKDLEDAPEKILGRKTYEGNIYAIRALDRSDIVDPKLINRLEEDVEESLTFHLVPNIGSLKAQRYASILREQLSEHEGAIEEEWIDEKTGNSIIDSTIILSHLNKIIDENNFLFKIYKKATLEKSDISTSYVVTDIPEYNIHFEDDVNNLPCICVIDTGVNEIPPLRSLISSKHFEYPLTGPEDNDGHGTCVSSLAVYGDNIDQNMTLVPKTRIVSRKVLDKNKNTNLVLAIDKAIYNHQECNVFTASVNYTESDSAIKYNTNLIDQIIQRANKLVIFSAGNISTHYIRPLINTGEKYPRYLERAQVFHPADGINIFSIGAYSKTDSQHCLAPSDAPSPFTRYGTNNKQLYSCPKPELVEHGGNLIFQNDVFTNYNVGVNTFDNRGRIVQEIGTSLAAPIVAHHGALLWHKYQSLINNVETIKAMVVSTCTQTRNYPKYSNFGKPNYSDLYSSEENSIRVIFEGDIPLLEIKNGVDTLYYDEIHLFIPPEIEFIDIVLVHSDNYDRNTKPELHSFLKVTAEKPGNRDINISPTLGRNFSRTHVKRLGYDYEKNVKGFWFFKVHPGSIKIPVKERYNVKIRYGCIMTLMSSESVDGLRDKIISGIRRVQSDQMIISSD